MKRRMRRLFYRATLADARYRFLFGRPPPDEVVAIDCETTGLDPAKDDVISVAAIIVRGERILTSSAFEAVVRAERKPSAESIKVHQIFEAEVERGRPIHEVIPDLLAFIGSRPIVGYYTDFDVRMLDKYVLRQIQIKMPNRQIDVSSMYYSCKYQGAPGHIELDLRFDAILDDLGIPMLAQHDAFNDAFMTAMIFVQLRDLQRRGVRIPRRDTGRNAETVPPTGG